MTVRERLRYGEFNTMNYERLPDGSALVSLAKSGDPHVYKMLVRDLYQSTEKVLSESVEELT